jgi:hypothetical protein
MWGGGWLGNEYLCARIGLKLMKSRQVSFFVDVDKLPAIMEIVRTEVLPSFYEMSHFLGLTVLKADRGDRSEIIAMSYWDDGLEDSDQVSQRFIDEINRVTGQNPSRRSFDILHAVVRGPTGDFALD